MPGTQVLTEMGQQPDVLARITSGRHDLHELIRRSLPERLRGVCLIARGSSDNVAIHARYLLELATGIPVSMLAPSIITRYRAVPEVAGWLVVALSQSGRTPEIVDVARHLRDRGATVVGITNDAGSPLAAAADISLSVGTSAERAVPATKTVTGQLALVTVLAEAAGAGISRYTGGDDAWARLAVTVRETLDDRTGIDAAVEVLAACTSAVHLARGLTYAAALEGALKSKETGRRVHDGYSSADFLHGPLTVAGPDVPVVAYGATGPVIADVAETARRAVGLGAPVIGVGAREVYRDIAGAIGVPVPQTLGEALAVIPLVVRGQQLAVRTTLALGMDPDSPEGLNKITATH